MSSEQLKAQIILYGFAAHLVVHYALRALITRLGPYEFTKRVRSKGLAQCEFVRDTSYNVHGFFLHVAQGPIAAYLSWAAVARAPRPPWPAMCAPPARLEPAPRPRRPPRQPSARAADPREFVARSDSAHSAGCLATYQATIMGPVFMSWTLFQIAWIAIGGERGVDNYVHHVLFLLAGFVAPYYSICGELILFSIAMEAAAHLCPEAPARPPSRAPHRARRARQTSTPALNVMLVCRQLERWQTVATAGRNLFALLFVAFRLVRPAHARVLSDAARWRPPRAPPRTVMVRAGPVALDLVVVDARERVRAAARRHGLRAARRRCRAARAFLLRVRDPVVLGSDDRAHGGGRFARRHQAGLGIARWRSRPWVRGQQQKMTFVSLSGRCALTLDAQTIIGATRAA